MSARRSSLAPALTWRAFLFTAVLISASAGAAPKPANEAPAPLLQFGEPDQAEGAKALEQLRRQGIAGDYYLEFQLRLMPRRGAEQLFAGAMWGAQNDLGLVSRVKLARGTPEARHLLIQNGAQPAVWERSPGRPEAVMLDGVKLFQPLLPGIDITPFDLQMPFIHWADFRYEGLTRFAGRPAHKFLLRPPAAFAAANPGLRGVRVQLDSQFNALVQVELLGEGDRVTKTTTVVDLKKVGGQWIVKTIDVRDEATKSKTRLSITAAALDLRLADTIFQPAELAVEPAVPEAAKITRISP